MPRDAAGNYTLPAGNPVISGTIITPTWANPTMGDLGNEMTDSLSRSGKGGMLVPFQNVDGTIGDPGITWINEPTTGFSRTEVNVMNASVGGIQSTRWVAGDSGFEIWSGTEWTKPNTAATNPIKVSGVNAAIEFEETGGGLISTLIRTATGFIIRPDSLVSTFDLIFEDGLLQWDARATWKFSGRVNFESSAALLNNVSLTGRILADTGDLRLVRLSATDVLEIGQQSSALNGAAYDSGNSASAHIFNINGIETARIDAVGIILAESRQLFARNTADDENFTIATKSFGSDVLVFGDSDSTGSQYNAPTSASGHRFFGGGVEGFRCGNEGAVLMNQKILSGRNVAADGAFDLMQIDSSDRMIIGDDARTNGAIYHASDHRFLGLDGDSFSSTTKAAGSLLVRDITDVTKKVGFRNPTRETTNANYTVLQQNEGMYVALNTGSTTITFPQLELLTTLRVINASGNGTAAEGAGMQIQRFTGTARVDGDFAMSFGSIYEFYQITTGIWYCWEVT